MLGRGGRSPFYGGGQIWIYNAMETHTHTHTHVHLRLYDFKCWRSQGCPPFSLVVSSKAMLREDVAKPPSHVHKLRENQVSAKHMVREGSSD